MPTRWMLRCVIVLMVLLVAAAPAVAQEKTKADVAVSYSLLYDKDLGDLGAGHGYHSDGWQPLEDT